ncbi:hypothetical protein Syun_030774 [Stephania yunnanensis]|uniref:Uncharacterized protein n=1 Tax=Stephania yunnanensis TaxID=152371 RepID=A0AAP0E306_9MAGN
MFLIDSGIEPGGSSLTPIPASRRGFVTSLVLNVVCEIALNVPINVEYNLS